MVWVGFSSLLLWCEELYFPLFLIFAFPHKGSFGLWLISLLLLRCHFENYSWFLMDVLKAWGCFWVRICLTVCIWLYNKVFFFLLPTLAPEAISKLLQLFGVPFMWSSLTWLFLSEKVCNNPWRGAETPLMIPHYDVLSSTFIPQNIYLSESENTVKNLLWRTPSFVFYFRRRSPWSFLHVYFFSGMESLSQPKGVWKVRVSELA